MHFCCVINQTNANLFKFNVSGLDIDLKYGFDVGNAGRISFQGNGTYFYKDAAQNADGSWTSQIDQGLTSQGGVIARWRHTATILYDVSDWDFSITQNFQKRYHDTASTITSVSRYVSAYDTFDAQVSYSGFKSLKFTVGAKNILDKDPPYANYASSANNFVGGYDLSYADPRGRFLYARVFYSLH
jgi:iron complex outermembrane receptor protein